MSFSPAPWIKIVERSEYYSSTTGERQPDRLDIWVKSGELNVALICNYGVDNQANANLIAAAPEILLACQGALVALSLGEYVDQSAAVSYLREVIAKAEGRKP